MGTILSFLRRRSNLLGSLSLAGVTLACGGNDGPLGSDQSDESLVLTINGVHSEVKSYSLQYRLYCGTSDSDVSSKIQSGNAIERVSDSTSITGNSLKFSNSDVKKLASGSRCVLDIYSSDSSAHNKFKWNFMDKSNSPVKGVFYVTSPGSVSNKKLSLTLYATYVNLADTFEAQVKTTYPKELASKSVSNVYLACGTTSESNMGASDSTTVDSSGTATHKFNLRKSDFKDKDHDCHVKSTLDGKNYKSKSAIKVAKNPDGKSINLSTDVAVDTSSPSSAAAASTQDVTIEISYQNTVCESKQGVAGCVPK
jgi:hypothetical protein